MRPRRNQQGFDGGVGVAVTKYPHGISTLKCGILREEHYNHVPNGVMSSDKFSSYSDMLIKEFTPIRKIEAMMAKDKAISDADVSTFLQACKDSRAIEGGITDPVQVLRRDFAMIGESCRPRPLWPRSGGDKGLAPTKSYGTPVPFGTVSRKKLMPGPGSACGRCQPRMTHARQRLAKSTVFQKQDLLDAYAADIKVPPILRSSPSWRWY